MMPTSLTRQSHTQLTPKIPHEPKTIWVCTTAWIIQLRRHTTSPAWYTSDYTWKSNCERHVVIPWSKGMASWSLNEPLLVPSYLCHQNKRRTRLRLRWIFPTYYSTPLQFFLRKCHHCGTWISLCLEEPSTPSTIFQHRRLPNSRNWATFQDISQGERSCEENSIPSTTANSEKSAIVPQKVHPYRTKPLPSVQPNVFEDYGGKEPPHFQHKFHMSPSSPSIVPPEVPVLNHWKTTTISPRW